MIILLYAITATLIVLKLAGFAAMSWLVTLIPALIALGIQATLIFGIILYVVALVRR